MIDFIILSKQISYPMHYDNDYRSILSQNCVQSTL